MNTTELPVQASLFFNRANMHLALALCMYFVMNSPSPFSSQLFGEICSNKIALAAWIRLNPIPNGIVTISIASDRFGFEIKSIIPKGEILVRFQVKVLISLKTCYFSHFKVRLLVFVNVMKTESSAISVYTF